MKLLHIDSSVLGDASVSRRLTADIVAKLEAAHPGLEIAYRDLAALDEFLAADVVVIGAPMYNFTIGSHLKAWLDRITVPGKTFGYADGRPHGLCGGKRVVLASSRGGVYTAGPFAPNDHQETYLQALLGFLGITDLEIVRAEGLNMGPEARDASIAAAQAGIGTLAA